MPKPVRRPVRALVVGVGVLAVLAACSSPDAVTLGERPNRPSAPVTPTWSSETDPAKLAIPLSQVPGYTPGTKGADGWTTGRMTDFDGSFQWRILGEDGQPVSNYDPQATVAFGDPPTYTDVPGVLTFRGNNHRTAPAYGTADIKEKKLTIAWTQETGETRGDGSYWPGAGWTGQPLLVNWPEQTRKAMGFAPEFADKNLVEVVYPTFEGKIYRLDLETGKQTKPPIDAKCGFKGTGSIDPRGYPLLYAGQGLDDMDDNPATDDCPFRYRIFDLIQNKEVAGWSGKDAAAPRKDWGAFDSSALVNAATDTLIEPAENGLIYKVKLNASFDAAAGSVSVDPKLTRLDYSTSISDDHGVESSAAAYRNLMFASDNDGNLVCWDATTMTVLWVRNVGDDSDATVVLDETPDGVFLYTGNEVDKRGQEGGNGELVTNLRKINALTGEQVWQYDIPAVASYPNNGGLMATPALGQGEVSDLVIFNVAKTGDRWPCLFGKCLGNWGGEMVALDKVTGKPAWTRHLADYSWSSPTLFTGTDGHSYGLFGDSAGVLHLFDPNTGEDFSTVNLGRNVEASVSVFNDMAVVASYDKKIFGIKLS